MNTKEITILKTWKDEEYEIDMKYEDFIIFEKKLKQEGEDGFDSIKYRRWIKFSSIETKIGKTLHLSLPEPKKEKHLYTDQEKEDFNRKLQKMMVITFEGRKKRFYERRKKILKDLEKDELKFGMETTIEKLKKLEIYNKKSILKGVKNVKSVEN